MRRRTFLKTNSVIVQPNFSVSSDICLYDKINKKKIIVIADAFNMEDFPSSEYSPVGVVVVPGSHNVYGDGSCAVISLVGMSGTTPNSGSTEDEYIWWGSTSTDNSQITNCTVVPCINSSNSATLNNTVKRTNSSGYISSDNFSKKKNTYDSDTWYSVTGSSYAYIPSPYNEDNTRNTLYFQTETPSASDNALADFSGKESCSTIYSENGSWKTSETIDINDDGYGSYPAIWCCWRYCPTGTSQGQWYLPAMGELGYIMPNLKKINASIENIGNAYNISVLKLGTQSYPCYYATTEYNSSYAWKINVSNGMVSLENKAMPFASVRSFLRVL